MAYNSVNIMPNQGLGIASGIAQGASSFMQAYQQGVNNRNYYAMMQQQMQSEQQLRQLQMQKLQQEINPVAVNLQKVGIVSKLADTNEDYSGLLQSYIKKTLDGANTPAQLSYLNNSVNSHVQSQMVPGNLGYANQQIPGPVQPGQAPLSYDKEIPGPPAPGAPQYQAQLPTQAKYEQMGMSQPSDFQSPPAPGQPPAPGSQRSYMGVPYQDLNSDTQDMMNGIVKLNPAELQMANKLITDRSAANIAMGRTAQGLYQTNINNMTKEQLRQLVNDANLKIQGMKDDTRIQATGMNNDTRQGIANSNNDAKTQIALGHDATSRANQNMRTNGKSGANNPMKAIDDQIKIYTTQKAALYGPQKGLIPMTDDDIKRKSDYLDSEISALQSKKESMQQGGGSSSTQSGLPSVARTKQDVSGLAAGSLFNWQGGGSMPAGIYKKQADGQLVPVSR